MAYCSHKVCAVISTSRTTSHLSGIQIVEKCAHIRKYARLKSKHYWVHR